MRIFCRRKPIYNVGKTGTKENKMQGYEMQKIPIPPVKRTSKVRDRNARTQCVCVTINFYNKPM